MLAVIGRSLLWVEGDHHDLSNCMYFICIRQESIGNFFLPFDPSVVFQRPNRILKDKEEDKTETL